MKLRKMIAWPLRYYSQRLTTNNLKINSKLLAEARIGYVDVGASGGLEPRWEGYKSLLNVFAFEPDERSREKLQQKTGYTVIGKALADSEGSRNFFLCKVPQVSSMLKPNISFLELFPNAERFTILKTIPMDVTTLDHCLKDYSKQVDFIKIDTQGSELEILKGGQSLLENSVIGLEIEIEFFKLYQNQPLFHDIDTFLSQFGFQFIDFTNLQRWGRYEHALIGQCVFGDALFLRSPENFLKFIEPLSLPEKKIKAKKYISILNIYSRVDLIEIFLSKGGKTLLDSGEYTLSKNLIMGIQNNHRYIIKVVQLANSFIQLIHPRFQLKLFI